MSDFRRTRFLRVLAYLVDWLLLVVWAGAVFGTVMLFSNGDPPRPSGPWHAQLIGFIAMTVPFTLYFTLSECSRIRASIGKRAAGLVVLRRSGEPLSFWRALSRSAVKFIPWELGHTVAQQAFYSGEDGLPTWVYGPLIVSAGATLWWTATLAFGNELPYDRWVGAAVRRREHGS